MHKAKKELCVEYSESRSVEPCSSGKRFTARANGWQPKTRFGEYKKLYRRIRQFGLRRRRGSQYIPMSQTEGWSFVKNHFTMVLCSLDSMGFPHATPVWYVVIGGKIYFRAQSYKKKIRNILRRPQVCGVVDDGEKYTELRGVMINGLAKIVDSDKAKRSQVFEMLAEKYNELRDTSRMPKLWQERFGKEHRVVVEITPTSFASWDNRKWLKRT